MTAKKNTAAERAARLSMLLRDLSAEAGGNLSPKALGLLVDAMELAAGLAAEAKPPVKLHPGHVLLRTFVPNASDRNRYVAEACRAEAWDQGLLDRAIERTTSWRPSEAQYQKIRAFIEGL